MIENKIKDYFNDRAHIAAVYLFGSHALGKERSDSDVDIAILFETRDPDVNRNLIDTYLVDLSRLLKKDIHPVVLNHAGELLLQQVFKKGKCIVVNDQRQLASFRMSAFAKIFDFSYYHALMQSGLIKSVMQGLP
jgi:predicted nucleotidyltransferase